MNPSTTPVEAEDMFPDKFLERFLHQHPGHFLSEQMQYSDGTYHYGFTQGGKKAFIQYVKNHLGKTHTATWVEILEHLRSKLGLS